MPDPAIRRKVIARVKPLVLKHHFNNGNVDYTEWSKAVDEQAPALVTGDDETFENGVRDLLSRLKSSHTNFFRSDTNPAKPQHAIGATLRSVTRNTTQHWMFLDVSQNGPAARAGITPGQLLLSVNGKSVTPPTFPTFRFGEDHALSVELSNATGHRGILVTVPP